MTFLTAMIERKKREAAALPDVHADISGRSMTRALRKKKTALIAEVKPRSPSEGPLLNLTNLPALLRAYNAHAQAISVLCDPEAFGGSYELLATVRTMTDLPILAKEFIVEEVCALGMCVLFEIHEEKDIAMIPMLPPDSLIIGINNRNLETLTIDLSTTLSLAPKIQSLFPKNLLISESGLAAARDIDLLQANVDGFLIGTTFLRSPEPKAAILSLFPAQ